MWTSRGSASKQYTEDIHSLCDPTEIKTVSKFRKEVLFNIFSLYLCDVYEYQ